jgi:hypothetical protein
MQPNNRPPGCGHLRERKEPVVGGVVLGEVPGAKKVIIIISLNGIIIIILNAKSQ